MKHQQQFHRLTVRRADLTDSGQCAALSAFVATHPQGSLFHRPEWLRAVEAGTGQQALCLTVEDGAGALRGMLPLTLMHHPLFGRALVSSGFGVGGGIVATGPEAYAMLADGARDLAGTFSVGSVELRGNVAALGPQWHIMTGAHENYACDLADDDEAQLKAIRRKQRAEVRRGLNHGCRAEFGNDDAMADIHYALYAESVRNLGTPVFPRALFDAMRAEFAEDAELTVIRCPRSQPVAAVLSFYHKGAVMPFWGGGGAAARTCRANEVMYYKLMCHARADRGAVRFDFGRSKIGSGSARFKRNFGIEPEPLAYASWAANGGARNISPESAKYRLMIEGWKRLPLPVANRIGPWLARGLG